jgi:uncharacterized RDD family membrane protein YckC
MFTILGADGKEYGPVPAEKVRAWIESRRASLQTRGRRDGETAWKTLGEFVEFGAAPPVASDPVAAAPVAPAEPPPAPPPPSFPPPPPQTPITVASMIGAPAAVPAPAGVELAGRGARLLARIIDGLTGAILVGPGYALIIFGGSTKNHVLVLAGLGLITLGGLLLLGIQLYLLYTRGQTIGKKLMNVRIADYLTNANPGLVKTFLVRAFVNGIICAIPFLGWTYSLVDICFIFREDRRCIHDLIAGTHVVKA